MINLETLVVDFEADFSSFDRTILQARRRYRGLADEIRNTRINSDIEIISDRSARRSEANLHHIRSELDRLGEEIDDARVNAEDIGRSLGSNLRSGFDGLFGGLDSLINDDGGLPEFLNGLTDGLLGTENAAALTSNQLLAFGTVVAGSLFAGKITETIGELFRFRMEVESIEANLKSLNDTNSTDIFRKFSEDANRAGIAVTSFAKSYSGLTAALKGKVADPTGLFNNIAEGFASKGISGETADRAFMALSQIASKGVVSMEELRQQLGEALPSAMSISARAMGVTEQELIKLVESGELLASDFLPLFAREISKTSGTVDTLGANLARLQNSFDSIKLDAAKVIPFNTALKGLRHILNALGKVTVPLTLLTMGGLAVLLGNVIGVAATLAVKLGLTKAAMIGFGAATLKVSVALAALYAGIQLDNFMMNKSNEATMKATKSLQSHTQALIDNKNARKGLPAEASGLSEGVSNFRTGNFIEDAFNGNRVASELKALDSFNKALDEASRSKIEVLDAASVDNISKATDALSGYEGKINTLQTTLANKDNLGLTSSQVRKLQEDLAKVQAESEDILNSFFKPESIASILKDLENLRKQAQEKISQGGDPLRWQSVIDELDVNIAEVNRAATEINGILQSLDPTIQIRVDASTLENSVKDLIKDFETYQQQDLFLQLSNASETEFEIAQRNQSIALLKEELSLYQEIAETRRTELEGYSKAAKDVVKSLAGVKGLGDIGTKEIARLDVNSDGRTLTPEVKNLIEAIKSLNENSKEVARVQLEQARAAREAGLALQQLERDIPKQILAGDRLKLDQQSLSKEIAEAFGDNTELENLKAEELSSRKNNLDQMHDLNNTFDNLGRGIESNTVSINRAIRDLSMNIEKAGVDVYKSALKGFSSFTSAAGIEDLFGISKFADLASKGASIKSSDRRPEIRNQIDDARFDFDIKQQSAQRELAKVNKSVYDSLFNINEEEKRASLTRKDLLESTEDSAERLSLSYRELQLRVSDYNREVESANLKAQDLGSSQRVSMVDMNVDTSLLGTSPDKIKRQMEDVLNQIDRGSVNLKNMLVTTARTRSAEINGLLEQERKATQRQLNQLGKSAEVEGQRIKQANANLAKELEGAVFGFTQNLNKKLQELTTRAMQAKDTVKGIFTDAGLPQFTPLKDRLDSVEARIDSEVANMEIAKTELDKVIDLFNRDASAGVLIGQITEGVNSGALSSDLGNRLIAEIERAGNSTEMKALVEEAKSLSKVYEREVGKLEGSKTDILNSTAELFNRKFNRQLEDIQIETFRSQVESMWGADDLTLATFKLEVETDQASQAVKRFVEDARLAGDMTPAQINKIEQSMKRLNAIKLDQLRNETELSFILMRSVAETMEGEIASSFTGFGELLSDVFKGEKNLFDGTVDLLVNSLANVAKAVADTAAQIASQKIIGGLFGTGGSSSGGILGSVFGGLFKDGGTVGEDSVGSTSPISDAMRREGQGATVIVAHKGEEVLTTRNKDAQFYRSLKKSGQWDSMKSGRISNFKNGGTVGGYAEKLATSKSNDRPSVMNYNSNVTYNLSGNTDNMRRSVSQLEAERQRRQTSIRDRNK